MKLLFLLCFIACWPRIAASQDSINPYIISQGYNIILQNTDVYYKPMAPDTTDTREALCNQADIYLDSNGVGNYGVYLPQVRDTVLSSSKPYGTVLGATAIWQRLFTAKRKIDGTGTCIIAGSHVTNDTTRTHGYGKVIISRNEDVDFRASKTIKLENGFHAMPGCRFHAYCDPQWGATVLSDDFDSSTIDRSKWIVSDSSSISGYGIGPNCAYDSNVTLVNDPDAHDGKALDIALIERTDSCECFNHVVRFDSCGEAEQLPSDSLKHYFSTGLVWACPFPYASRSNPMDSLMYDHVPYGKYEIRVKVPHIPHHMNTTWVWDNSFEFDNESDNANIDSGWYHNTIYRNVLYGPFKGVFKKGIDTEFVSNGPDWWYGSNSPTILVINNFPYQVKLLNDTSHNTVVADGDMIYKRWPASLVNYPTDSFTFYYARQDVKYSDPLAWKVTKDSAGKWRILNAPYHVDRSGDTLRFSKAFQPLWITLKTSNAPPVYKTFNCYWDSSLNSPTDKGLLWLKDDSLLTTGLHNNTEVDTFFVEEGMHYHYSYPPIQFANPADSASYYNPSSYKYHTFTLELLPNEARFLLDSAVIRRYPDRLIPTTDKHANWIATLPRFAPTINIGQMTLDGLDSSQWSILLNHIADCPGCWDVGTKHAAHTRIDYFKVFDIPDEVKVSEFPQ